MCCLIPFNMNLGLLTGTAQLMASRHPQCEYPVPTAHVTWSPGSAVPAFHQSPGHNLFQAQDTHTGHRTVSSWRDKEDEVPLIILAHLKEMTLSLYLLTAICVLGTVSPNYGKNYNTRGLTLLLFFIL